MQKTKALEFFTHTFWLILQSPLRIWHWTAASFFDLVTKLPFSSLNVPQLLVGLIKSDSSLQQVGPILTPEREAPTLDGLLDQMVCYWITVSLWARNKAWIHEPEKKRAKTYNSPVCSLSFWCLVYITIHEERKWLILINPYSDTFMGLWGVKELGYLSCWHTSVFLYILLFSSNLTKG